MKQFASLENRMARGNKEAFPAVLLFAVVLTIVSQSASAQVTLSRRHRPVPTVDQFIATVGDEPTVATIVSMALAEFVRGRQPRTTALVSAAQIRENWLPVIAGVQFIRLSDEGARDQFEHCGRLVFLDSLERVTADAIAITVAEGHKCRVLGSTYQFNRSSDGWRLPGGLAAGFGSGIGDGCECRQFDGQMRQR